MSSEWYQKERTQLIQALNRIADNLGKLVKEIKDSKEAETERKNDNVQKPDRDNL